mgnify:CR=1 FL=1
METRNPSISPLRQRMIEDMRMRKFGEKTQYQYVRAVRQFAKYLGRSPETASVEELRNYQLHLVDHGTSPASLNSAICSQSGSWACSSREMRIASTSMFLSL